MKSSSMKRGSAAIAASLVFVAHFGITTANAEAPDKGSGPSESRVVLMPIDRAGLTPAALAGLLAAHGLTLVETRSIFQTADDVLTVGLPSSGGKLPANAAFEIDATLTDMQLAADENAAASVSEGKGINPLPSLVAAAHKEMSNLGVRFDEVVVLTNGKSDLELPPSVTVKEEAEETTGDGTTNSISAASSCRWHPYYNSSTSNASSSGGRYNALFFQWSSTVFHA